MYGLQKYQQKPSSYYLFTSVLMLNIIPEFRGYSISLGLFAQNCTHLLIIEMFSNPSYLSPYGAPTKIYSKLLLSKYSQCSPNIIDSDSTIQSPFQSGLQGAQISH
ncbi:Hypothetical_protein [Hexamita inflata]|uniref:Hypothetical_protein n=1 Tax=Hexamita inflata TaxID=28002 RepID=A0AA86U1Y5_9EUKA|nr:Hypothetical protein HINF_LOCUS26610 [Hexamita inflata]